MTPEHEAYLVAENNLRTAKVAEANALKVFQESCRHDTIYETPMRDGYFTTHAPMRVCVTCGWAEEGWGCGYGLLADGREAIHISINRFNELRRGPVHQWKPGQPHRHDRTKVVECPVEGEA